jgi:hypothetical protein
MLLRVMGPHREPAALGRPHQTFAIIAWGWGEDQTPGLAAAPGNRSNPALIFNVKEPDVGTSGILA